MKNLTYLVVAVLCASCTSNLETSPPSEPVDTTPTTTESSYTPISFELENRDDEPSDAERKRCTDAGGSVMRDGILGVYRCTQNYPDAGQACSNSSECLGRCEVEGLVADDGAATGVCQRTDSPFGCFAIVENGQARPAICVD